MPGKMLEALSLPDEPVVPSNLGGTTELTELSHQLRRTEMVIYLPAEEVAL